MKSNGSQQSNRGTGGRRTIAVHPNSTAARKWGYSSWTTTTGAAELAGAGAVVLELTTRDHAMRVACRVCGASAGQSCRRIDMQERVRQHAARHGLAIQNGAPIVKRVSKRKRVNRSDSRARDKR